MKIFTRLCLGLLFFCLLGTTGINAQEKATYENHEIRAIPHSDQADYHGIRSDRPLIGIYTGHSEDGIAISSTVQGGGAETAGLEAGDVITAINNQKISNVHQLQIELSKYQGGEQVAITYERSGQSRNAKVTLKAKPNIRPDRPLIGIFPGNNDGHGIMVDDISAGGGAVNAGIKSGDVITKINAVPVNNMTDLKVELSKYQAGEQVAVEYLRNGAPQQTSVTLKDRSENHGAYRSRDRDPCAVFIGVSLSGKGIEGQGVHVGSIIDETPAQTFGVKGGDDILALDKVTVNSFNELLHERDKHQPGDDFTLTILREGQIMDIKAQFKTCENEAPATETPVEIEQPTRGNDETPNDFAIENTLKVEEWKAFPNPAFGTLNVQFQGEAAPTTVSLIDGNGRAVYRETMNRFDGYYNQQIDLTDIGPGNYFLQIRQGDQMVTEKIVVMPRA